MTAALGFALLALLFVLRRVPWDDDSPGCDSRDRYSRSSRGPPDTS